MEAHLIQMPIVPSDLTTEAHFCVYRTRFDSARSLFCSVPQQKSLRLSLAPPLCSACAAASSFLNRFLSPPATSPVSPLHRLLSAAAAAPAASSNPSFSVEQYLVDTCGLTRAQALKASAKLSHLKSRTNPDAVLAFLAGLGFSSSDVAAVVAKDPEFLCARVEKTLSSNVSALTGLGLSTSEVARLVSLAPDRFRRRFVVSKLQYYLLIFGSVENLLRVFKFNTILLRRSLEKVVKPNVVFLRQCGIGDCHMAKLSLSMARMLTNNPETVQATVACAEGLGVPRGSGMFRQALQAVALLSEEKIAVQVKCLKDTFRWSDAEAGIAFCKFPVMLKMSKDNLQRKSEFLISEVGLEPTDIAHRPVMIGLSLEGRLRPRYYVVRFLKENGLVDRDRSYYCSLMPAEKVFVEKYIHPYKETAPCLAKDYAAACRGEVPTRFRFT